MYNFILNTRRMTFSALVIAIYIAVLYVTQGISFGPYQIRIATALYGLAFLYPFLVVPLGIANFIANFLFGGLGLIDMVGGCAVGMMTTWLIVQIRQHQGSPWLAALPIWWVPALVVQSLAVLFIESALPGTGQQPGCRSAAAGYLRRPAHSGASSALRLRKGVMI